LSSSPASSEPAIAAATAEALVERVALLGDSGAPLADGLRAAAAESDSLRLARALRHVAGKIEQGQKLDEVIAASSRRLPAHLSGLIRAAQRSGHLGGVLAEWLANRRAARQQWRAVLAAFTYPAITLTLAVVLYIVFAKAVVAPFRTIVDDFGIRVPVNTTVLFWVSETGLTWLGWAALILAGLLIALRVLAGPAAWSMMISQLPLIGPAWHWTGVAEMLRCLGLLIERSVPLPEALRLTGDGIADAGVGRACRQLAARLEAGQPLYMAILDQRALPVSIVPLVRWGEQSGALAEGLRSAAEMLEGRLRLRTAMLIQVIPPLLFLLVALLIVPLLTALLSTMLMLIQGLT
jgi:type II secretory pathway component PulF